MTFDLLELDEDGYPVLKRGDPEYIDGAIIKLSAKDFDILCERYSFDGDRQKFKKLLQERDEWYGRQSYSTYRNWLQQTINWLERNKQAREHPDREHSALGVQDVERLHPRGQGGFQKALVNIERITKGKL